MTITTEAAMQLTIGEIAMEHYLPEKRARRRANTVYGYESSINLHVLPRWEHVRICDVTHDDVQAWVDEHPDNPGGIEKAYKCLRQIIRWAMDKWSLIMADPTRKVEMPYRPAYKPETLTERRLKKLVRGLMGCIHEATGIIQAAVGPRPCENYELDWTDIDWRTGRLPIDGGLHQIPGLVYEAPPKTPKGDRESWLPKWALDRLHAIWVALGRPKGRIIGDRTPSQVFYVLKAWARKHKLPWVGMKNLRHTWGTIAAKHNPIEAVSAMMGHSTIQTTYRYYYQLTLGTVRRVQRKVARSILGKTCDDMYKGLVIKFPQPTELPMAA